MAAALGRQKERAHGRRFGSGISQPAAFRGPGALTAPTSSQGAPLTAEAGVEGGGRLLLQLSSHINERVIRRQVCPYGRSVALETKTGLKPNHCQDLFVEMEPQTRLLL